MTAPKTINLPALSAALEGRTKGDGPLEVCADALGVRIGAPGLFSSIAQFADVDCREAPEAVADAAAVVAGMNAIDDLISLARAAVAYRDACEAVKRASKRGIEESLNAAADRYYAAMEDARVADRALLTLAARFSNTAGGDE